MPEPLVPALTANDAGAAVMSDFLTSSWRLAAARIAPWPNRSFTWWRTWVRTTFRR